MSLRERLVGRDADTPEVVTYKNYTLADWLVGTSDDPAMQMIIAFQRLIGVAGFIMVALMFAYWCFYGEPHGR